MRPYRTRNGFPHGTALLPLGTRSHTALAVLYLSKAWFLTRPPRNLCWILTQVGAKWSCRWCAFPLCFNFLILAVLNCYKVRTLKQHWCIIAQFRKSVEIKVAAGLSLMQLSEDTCIVTPAFFGSRSHSSSKPTVQHIQIFKPSTLSLSPSAL